MCACEDDQDFIDQSGCKKKWVGGFGLVAKLYLTLFDPVDCSPPGTSTHGISQARILEWIAISYSKGSDPGIKTTSALASEFLITEPPGKPKRVGLANNESYNYEKPWLS